MSDFRETCRLDHTYAKELVAPRSQAVGSEFEVTIHTVAIQPIQPDHASHASSAR